MKEMEGIAILAAAGESSRAGTNKIWLTVGQKTLLQMAAEPFFLSPVVDRVVVVVSEEMIFRAMDVFAEETRKPVHILAGGRSRTESVRKALCFLRDELSVKDAIVGVHDGARPYATQSLVTRCFLQAAKTGSAVPVIPSADSMRRLSGETSVSVDRSSYVLVQTPQCFTFDRLLAAYQSGEEGTDDACLYERLFGAPTLTEGEFGNKKITYSSDVSEILNHIGNRVGVGFDVHPLKEGRRLVLGGIQIPFEKGLVGHSDADALIHAIMDALLTAAGLPDIGHYFPPSDPRFEGACSVDLLRVVKGEIDRLGYFVVNVAGMIMAEQPKMAPFIPDMEKKIAKTLGISEQNVKFAATTTEKLGIVGEGKGIAAEATVLLSQAKTH